MRPLDNSKPFGVEQEPMSASEWGVVLIGLSISLAFLGLAFIGGLVLFNVIAG